MIYYFLVLYDNESRQKKHIIGPFLNSYQSKSEYMGQIIRSTEFSMEYLNNELELDLYCINSNIGRNMIKYNIIKDIDSFHLIPDYIYICNFRNILNDNNTLIYNDYEKICSLRFSRNMYDNKDIIDCPFLTIIKLI